MSQYVDNIMFTANAVDKVRELIEEEGNNDLCLRVFITHTQYNSYSQLI